jgi:hypothetical protein
MWCIADDCAACSAVKEGRDKGRAEGRDEGIQIVRHALPSRLKQCRERLTKRKCFSKGLQMKSNDHSPPSPSTCKACGYRCYVPLPCMRCSSAPAQDERARARARARERERERERESARERARARARARARERERESERERAREREREREREITKANT